MDLNELKNLNMQDLKAKVLAFADKKTLIKIGISLGSIIVFFPIYPAIPYIIIIILCDFCDNFLPDLKIIINNDREICLISLPKYCPTCHPRSCYP